MNIVHPLLCGCIFYTVLIDKNSWKIYNYSIAYKNKRKGENLLEKFLNKMERKFGRYAIPGLMKYICVLYIIGLFINIASPQVYYYYLSLNPYRILHGEVWRLVTFLIQSPNSNVIFFIFTLYLYYMLGQTLESVWGTFRFNLYYFAGVLFTIIGSFAAYFMTGQVYLMDTYYINMSLFLAFAFVFPDMEMLLMFLIPIKIKWLAYLDIALFVYEMVVGNIGTKISIAMALLNFVIFFFGFMRKRVSPAQMHRRAAYKKAVKKMPSRHRCAVCGRTEETNPELEFRFCSKCNGNYEYCQDHLFTHTHVQ